MVNVITRLVSMEIVWRCYGDSVESDTFYGDFVVKSVWRLSRVFTEKTWLIKLADNLHINFTIKSKKQKTSLSLLSPYYLLSFYRLWRRNIFPVCIYLFRYIKLFLYTQFFFNKKLRSGLSTKSFLNFFCSILLLEQ